MTEKTEKPRITISTRDAERLDELVASLPNNSPGKLALEQELDRAEVVDSTKIPTSVVTMNSKVRFKVTSSSEEFCLKLVYPKDADASGGTISILAPIGSALLGLSEADEIDWPGPGGESLRVRIMEILYQPERAGDYHR